MFVFGGKIKENQTLNEMYVLQEKNWIKLEAQGDIRLPRYNHACVVYNKMMFIYSGLNNEEMVLDDFYAFDFECGKWKKIVISGCQPVRLRKGVVLGNNLWLLGN